MELDIIFLKGNGNAKKVSRLAYKSLCLPHLEYACAAWNPSTKQDIAEIESIQNQATRFIASIKGRNDLEETKSRLGLAPLHQRRRNQHLALLMNILSKDENHLLLLDSYGELIKQNNCTITTRAQSQGVPSAK